MKAVRPTLIELFSRLSCDEIESGEQPVLDAFGETSFASVTSLKGYAEEYNRVKTAKQKIEHIEQKYSQQHGDQALQCLCLLKELRTGTVDPSHEFVVTRDLIQRTLYARWPKPDQDLFDERRRVFDQWVDFFLSYTNRDASATNNRYKSLISAQFGWPRKAEVLARNQVAKVIAKFLEQHSLRGFVDYNNMQCGDEIEDKIIEYCRTAIAFVQLVEDEALREPPPPKANWCHKEHFAFTQAKLPVQEGQVQANRRFFVLAGGRELAAPENMGEAYREWFQDMSSRLDIVIDSVNVKPWDNLKLEVRKVARQILTARAQLIDSMLATWH